MVDNASDEGVGLDLCLRRTSDALMTLYGVAIDFVGRYEG
jgi:hypothetical protein